MHAPREIRNLLIFQSISPFAAGLDPQILRKTLFLLAVRLDEAEKVCHDLLRRFPDAVDGIERLGHVHEVRADLTTAAAHYRKAAAFIRETEMPEDEHAAWLDQLADRIDPS